MIDEYTGKKIISPLDMRDETPLPLSSNLNALNPDAVTVFNCDPSDFPISVFSEDHSQCQTLSQSGQLQHSESFDMTGTGK